MKLHVEITLLITSAVLLVCIVSLMMVDRLLHDRVDYELKAKGQILVEGLSESIAQDVIDSEVLGVTDVLNKIVQRTRNVSYSYIIGFDGNIFAHSFREGFPKILLPTQHDDDEFPIIKKYLLEGKTVVDVSYPLIKGLKAHVHIGMDESYHHAQYFSFRKHILFLAATVILLGLLLSLVVSRRIIKPMKELSGYVNAFGQGALTGSIDIGQAAPEVAQLAQSFNHMVACRKEAEQSLMESEEQFRQLTENIRDVFWLGSPDWSEIIYISPAYEEIWGKSCDSLYAEPLSWLDSIPEEDKEAVLSFLQKEIETDCNEMIFPEYRVIQPDGSVKWISARCYPIRDAAGKMIRVAGIAEDITESKKAKENLQLSEDRFRVIMDSLDSHVYVADMESYELLFLNKYGREAWGDVIGKTCWKSLQKDQTGPCSFCSNEKLLAADGTPSGVYVWELQNTITNEWYECRDQAIRWPDGRFVRMEIATNISERKKTDETLHRVNRALLALSNINNAVIKSKEEEELLQKICNILVKIGGYRFAWIAFAENDEEQSVRAVSQAGFEDDYLEHIRISWADNEYGQGPTGTAIRTGKLCMTGDIINDPSYTVWREETTIRGYASSIALPLKTNHHTFGALNIYADAVNAFNPEEIELLNELAEDLSFGITTLRVREEHKKAEEEKIKLQAQLFQSQKMEAIGTLAGGIAHDFNNILSAIIGYAEFVKAEALAESRIGKNIAEVLGAAERATDLVKQILTCSRQLEHEKQVLLPYPIVKEALQMLRATFPATAEIKEDIDPDCGTVLADPTNIYQITVNLCTNALHALTDQKGSLSVGLQHLELSSVETSGREKLSPGPFVVLSVSDSGCGMDQPTIDRIFEPYFTTEELGKGTGLGLAIVNGIVEDCKGFIEVESVVGKGSTFSVYFPVVEESVVQHVASEQKNGAATTSGGERVLVVDDEPLLVKINQKRLESRGYQVTALSDSRLALEKFRDRPEKFDLLITDQTMPGLSGAELAKAVLEIKPSMPIIMCTGHSDIVPKEKALSMGIKKYVFKPIHGDELLDAVQEVLAEE